MTALDERVARFTRALERTVQYAPERDRLVAALNDLIAWSQDGPSELVLNENEHEQSVVSFRHAPTGRVAWSAYPKDDGGAKLEVFARSREGLPAAVWTQALEEVRGLSREPLTDNSTLRIPFTALKSPATRARVKQLILRLAASLSENRSPGDA